MLRVKRRKPRRVKRKDALRSILGDLLVEMTGEDDPEVRRELQAEYGRIEALLQNEEVLLPISPEALLGISANMLAVLLIIYREEFNVVRSAAMAFVRRGH